KGAKLEMQATRNKTRKVRAGVRAVTRQISTRTSEQLRVRNSLVVTQQELADARRLKESALSSVRESKDEYLSEVNALLAQSAAIAAKIRASQSGGASGSGAAPSGGLGWPVSGPVTSGFGERWGRMHEGIDIGVPTGTPVAAAAGGTVLVAGWMGGYGNLVVLDHGNGLATAYGHNSSLSVGVGQTVSKGQTIALAGSTGHSFGPHVHFEVRVNGNAVNPLAYL
ncbi:MAG: M23 family metallopeptidase, partial [Candidatus Limnocylindria bacterium]|nr:M23 family metallopeptidase [Candidatus Limnocylindria bacterium]